MAFKTYIPCRRKGYQSSPPEHIETIDPDPPNGVLDPWSLEHRMKMIRYAQQLTDRKMIVLSLVGKVPSVSAWQEISDYQKAFKIVKERLTKGSNNNIGIQTGIRSNLIVLDIDTIAVTKKGLVRSGYTIWNRWIAKYGEPQTFMVRTGKGGLHVYFRYPQPPLRRESSSGNQIVPGYGIDFRSDGGQIVAFGSVHPKTNHPYLPINHQAISELPGWLRYILENNQEPPATIFQPIKPAIVTPSPLRANGSNQGRFIVVPKFN